MGMVWYYNPQPKKEDALPKEEHPIEAKVVKEGEDISPKKKHK